MASSNLSVGASGSASDRRIFKMKKVLVATDIFDCFKKGVFCDVALNADDGERIPAHRVALYLANPNFVNILPIGLNLRGQEEITINEVDGAVLRKTIEYCYSGEIAIDSTNAEEMWKVATKLQFTELRRNCTEFHSAIVPCASNCLRIWNIANLYNLVPLKLAADAIALEHFIEVSNSDEFAQLDADHLSALIKDDDLKVLEEEDVFNVLMKWFKHDTAGEKQSLGALLECVRFKGVSDSFIFHEVYQQLAEVNCSELLLPIIARRSSKDLKEEPRCKPFQFYCVQRSAGINVSRYCSRAKLWTNVKTIDLSITSFAAIHCDGGLMILGGLDAEKKATNAVKSVDFNTGEVVDLAPMIKKREWPGVELINNSVYVFDGLGDRHERVSDVERFDRETNEWSKVAPMNTARLFPSHVVLLDRLFVMGGVNKQNKHMKSVEYYNPATNKWKTVAPMQQARAQAAMSVSNGFIYVLGGKGPEGVLKSVERYDPLNDSWTEMMFVLSAPRYWYRSPAFPSRGDWVYIAGGADSKQTTVNMFEKINIVTGDVVGLKDLPNVSLFCFLIKC